MDADGTEVVKGDALAGGERIVWASGCMQGVIFETISSKEGEDRQLEVGGVI